MNAFTLKTMTKEARYARASLISFTYKVFYRFKS